MDISARSVICRYTSKETYSGVLSREVYLCLYFGELIRLLFFVITISFSISATSVEPYVSVVVVVECWETLSLKSVVIKCTTLKFLKEK